MRSLITAMVLATGWTSAPDALAGPHAVPDAAGAAEQTQADLQEPDLSRLTLEELARVEVTSVSRRPEALATAAAAVFVISADDIRRSGVTSTAEALRLAPNLNVQRVNAVDYAITARGFNGFETSNKLLVMLDGRSLYSTLSSGVFWDARELMLEDIDRIEVISGPGGALYGANAVNGVINIITRSAEDTLGTALIANVGTEDATLSVRHGGVIGDRGAWRAYVRGFAREDSFERDGTNAADAAHGVRLGGRADWRLGAAGVTVQADAFDNTVAVNEGSAGTDTTVRGGNLLGRWTGPLFGGDLQVQGYYDRFERDEPDTRETSDTADLFLQQSVRRGRHTLVVGAGYRTERSKLVAAPGGAFLDPQARTLTLANVFAQDQIALRPDLSLTLGAKFEDNSFTGREFLPNARIAWSLPDGDLIWAAVSRASRTPNRIEQDLTLPGFLEPGQFRSERLTAYEVGYRSRPTQTLSVSVSAFYNDYDSLRTVSITPVTVLPFRLTNVGRGTTYGLEAWGTYDVGPDWRLSAGVSALAKDFEIRPGESDISELASVGDDPSLQVIARSQSSLTDRLDLDIRLRAVEALATVPAYVEADVRLGWRLNDAVELSITGQALLNDRRLENGDPVRARAFGRSVTAGLRVTF